MPITAFDTLRFVKSLRTAGFDESQAEALSDAFAGAQEGMIAGLATKRDIESSELAIRADVEKWRSELKSEIQEVRSEQRSDNQLLRHEFREELRNSEARLEPRFAKIEADIKLIKWMLSVGVAGVVALALKAFLGP